MYLDSVNPMSRPITVFFMGRHQVQEYQQEDARGMNSKNGTRFWKQCWQERTRYSGMIRIWNAWRNGLTTDGVASQVSHSELNSWAAITAILNCNKLLMNTRFTFFYRVLIRLHHRWQGQVSGLRKHMRLLMVVVFVQLSWLKDVTYFRCPSGNSGGRLAQSWKRMDSCSWAWWTWTSGARSCRIRWIKSCN